ncbi:hypothetical protein EDD86DRAFT_143492 [Gorgonomyces haynaldii]|nr:hypothetical protein EDD86DRAFT_143492 [Gorgonomyces haynaldii]
MSWHSLWVVFWLILEGLLQVDEWIDLRKSLLLTAASKRAQPVHLMIVSPQEPILVRLLNRFRSITRMHELYDFKSKHFNTDPTDCIIICYLDTWKPNSLKKFLKHLEQLQEIVCWFVTAREDYQMLLEPIAVSIEPDALRLGDTETNPVFSDIPRDRWSIDIPSTDPTISEQVIAYLGDSISIMRQQTLNSLPALCERAISLTKAHTRLCYRKVCEKTDASEALEILCSRV